MITLLPGSTCDIGAEEFSAHRPPYTLPCGHVLCRACCDAIVEKSPPRLEPVCPFCREAFKASDPRVVRVDWSVMPRSQSVAPPINDNPTRIPSLSGNIWKEHSHPSDNSRGRPEARQLEDKVAKLAATKTSVEAIQNLLADLDHWLLHAKRDSSSTSLSLSAALLRAILMNHLAHSEAMKHARTVEANLRGEVDNVKMSNSKLQEELRRTREEASSLRQEVNSLRVLHTTLSPSSIPLPESRATSAPTSAATSPASSPSTSPTPYNQPTSFFSRMGQHLSSASAAAHSSPSRSATPSVTHTRSHSQAPARAPSVVGRTTSSAPSRAATPAVRSQTPAVRSHTPSITSRSTSHIPVPPMPSLPSRYNTPAPAPTARAKTPATSTPPRPSAPAPSSTPLSASATRSRRLSIQTPTKIGRSTSDESGAHERWLPTPGPEHHSSGPTPTQHSSTTKHRFSLSLSRNNSLMATAAAARFKDARSPSVS